MLLVFKYPEWNNQSQMKLKLLVFSREFSFFLIILKPSATKTNTKKDDEILAYFSVLIAMCKEDD